MEARSAPHISSFCFPFLCNSSPQLKAHQGSISYVPTTSLIDHSFHATDGGVGDGNEDDAFVLIIVVVVMVMMAVMVDMIMTVREVRRVLMVVVMKMIVGGIQ